MLKKPANAKIPLLISITLFIVVLAIDVSRDPLEIAMVLLGSLAGTFLLDLDYILIAYFLEPEKDFSKTLRGFIKHYDFKSANKFIKIHKNNLKEKTLNSALFQIVLAALAIFAVASNTSMFVKALVLSMLVNSMYRMVEEYFEGRIQEWFWAVKINPKRNTFYLYSAVMSIVVVFCLSLL